MALFGQAWSRRVAGAAVGLLAAFSAVGAAPALAQETLFRAGARNDVVVDGQGNVIALGARVGVLGQARGDIWALGAQVEVDTVTDAGLSALGGSVDVRGRYGGDAWVTGGNVSIDATVAGRLRVVAASVTVGRTARVGAGSTLAGASVTFGGEARGALTIAGDEIVVTGRIAGPLTLEGRAVRIADGADIDGDVIVRSDAAPAVAAGARIAGRLTVEPPPPRTAPVRDWSFNWMVVLAFAASAFVVAASIMLLMPAVMATATGTVRNRLPLALINGLLAAIGGPIVAVALVLILVTLPLGAFLFMAFPLLALLGHGTIGSAVGERLLAMTGLAANTFMRLVALAVGVGLVAALGLIPYLGIPLVLLLLVIGVGAALLAFAEHLFGSGPKSAT